MDPVVAAILEATPALPPIQSTPLGEYRDLINQMTQGMPRYDVPLAAIVDRTIDTAGQPLDIRLYTPHGDGPLPLLVYFHGGGFTIGDLEVSDAICRAIAAGAGCLVISVDYRLAPEHPYPAPVNDCWNALLWAIGNAADIGAGKGLVAVGGDSAGGNLAASVALRARDAGVPLAAQLLLYAAPTCNLDYPSYTEFGAGPVLTMDDIRFYWDQYLPKGVDRTLADATPLHATDHRGLAPAFVASPELDPTRDATEAYGAKLAEAGCDVFMKRYSGLPHGFYAFVPHVPAVQTAMAELTSWLRNRWQKTG